MGEIFSYDKAKLIHYIFLFFLLLVQTDAHSSYRELDLFDKGYEDYLSYRPEKAVEEFQAFLKEFPDSSVRDAAMFWLAKAYLQVRDMKEAEKTFSELKIQMPKSPFVAYADRELKAFAKRTEDEELVALSGNAPKHETEIEMETQQPPGTAGNRLPAEEQKSTGRTEELKALEKPAPQPKEDIVVEPTAPEVTIAPEVLAGSPKVEAGKSAEEETPQPVSAGVEAEKKIVSQDEKREGAEVLSGLENLTPENSPELYHWR